MKSRLETLVNVCLVVTCVLTSSLAVKQILRPSQESGRNSKGPPPPEYRVGDKLPPIDGLQYAEGNKTVVLFISTHCRFCADSLPFYKRLAELSEQSGFRVVIAASEPEALMSDYLRKNAVKVTAVRTVPPELFKVAATPTIIVADRDGKVAGYWRGLLNGREREVETALMGN